MVSQELDSFQIKVKIRLNILSGNIDHFIVLFNIINYL